jgi:hypothetical protein
MLLTCKDSDNSIRWKEGERLDHLFEQRCDDFTSDGDEGHLAVVTENVADNSVKAPFPRLVETANNQVWTRWSN